MFFFFTCGTHTFTSRLAGYENLTVQCQNCGNHSGHVYKRWEWFTFCFIPVIPFSLKPYKEVGCHVCNFYQDIKFRPDVQGNMGGGGVGGQNPQGYAMGAPPGPQGQYPQQQQQQQHHQQQQYHQQQPQQFQQQYQHGGPSPHGNGGYGPPPPGVPQYK